VLRADEKPEESLTCPFVLPGDYTQMMKLYWIQIISSVG